MPPVEILVERDALQKIPDLTRRLALDKNCLVVHDMNTREIAGRAIIDLLRKEGHFVSEMVVDKPDEANVERVLAKVEGESFLVGVGGSSVLDVTKLAAHRRRARYILFSTGIANNGMSSKTASIYVSGKKESIPVNLADAVMVDLTIISKAPAWMIAAGCGDLAGDATAVKDWQLGRDEMSEPYCDSIAALMMSALDDFLKNVDSAKSRSEGAIRSLANAQIRSGLATAIWGSSRPASGSEHLWSHWLDDYAEQNNTKFGQHGEQVGIGSLLMAKYHELHNPNWWDKARCPQYQAETLMSSLKKVGAPTTPSEIGVDAEKAKHAFVGAWQHRKERYTILHKRHPAIEDAEGIMRELNM